MKTAAQIAAELNIPVANLCYYIRKHGIKETNRIATIRLFSNKETVKIVHAYQNRSKRINLRRDRYVRIGWLAHHINLPKYFLQQLADDGKIPFLIDGKNRRFNPEAVRSALSGLAAKPSKPQKKTVLGVSR